MNNYLFSQEWNYRPKSSDKILVYRMEDFGGNGPRTNGHIFYVLNRHNIEYSPYGDSKKYPNPYEEKIIDYDSGNIKKYHCGVLDMDIFFHWFPKEYMPEFEEKQSFISCYEVSPENVKIGSKQVIFRRDRSKLLLKIKPTQWNLVFNN